MTLILIEMLVHISNILTVLLTQKHVFRTKHIFALSSSTDLRCNVIFLFSYKITVGLSVTLTLFRSELRGKKCILKKLILSIFL